MRSRHAVAPGSPIDDELNLRFRSRIGSGDWPTQPIIGATLPKVGIVWSPVDPSARAIDYNVVARSRFTGGGDNAADAMEEDRLLAHRRGDRHSSRQDRSNQQFGRPDFATFPGLDSGLALGSRCCGGVECHVYDGLKSPPGVGVGFRGGAISHGA